MVLLLAFGIIFRLTVFYIIFADSSVNERKPPGLWKLYTILLFVYNPVQDVYKMLICFKLQRLQPFLEPCESVDVLPLYQLIRTNCNGFKVSGTQLQHDLKVICGGYFTFIHIGIVWYRPLSVTHHSNPSVSTPNRL